MPGVPSSFTTRTLIDGSDVYTDYRDLEGSSTPNPDARDRFWVHIDRPKGEVDQGAFLPGDENPGVALLYLKGASAAEAVGSERLRGEPTTRYAVTYDMAKLAAQGSEELEKFLEDSGAVISKPVDVWIDRQGHLRKIHYTLTLDTEGEKTSPRMNIVSTLELYDFGVAVNVTAPPADQVEVIGPDRLPSGLIEWICGHMKNDKSASPTTITPAGDLPAVFARVSRPRFRTAIGNSPRHPDKPESERGGSAR